ncbi:MAG: AraC family transcriptional regulator ligand-binding domain-containing protein [Alcanivorax sp.]|nr:AraC family transcriptional regulator ligand-binding domain-containing protein [Alcanivorax sp.]
MVAASSGYKISIELVKKALDLGRQFGIPVDELLDHNGIRIEPLKGDSAYMAGKELEFILSIGIRQMPDPLPGLTLGLIVQQQLFGFVAFLAQTASTVGACLEKVIEAEPLIGDTGTTRLEYLPGEAIWFGTVEFTILLFVPMSPILFSLLIPVSVTLAQELGRSFVKFIWLIPRPRILHSWIFIGMHSIAR